MIDIIKSVQGNCYIPGGGAEEYQRNELFTANGITIQPQNFKHPVYSQLNCSEFVPGLSIIDTIMNVGLKQTEVLIKNG